MELILKQQMFFICLISNNVQKKLMFFNFVLYNEYLNGVFLFIFYRSILYYCCTFDNVDLLKYIISLKKLDLKLTDIL